MMQQFKTGLRRVQRICKQGEEGLVTFDTVDGSRVKRSRKQGNIYNPVHHKVSHGGLHRSENASQGAEIVNGVYGTDTVTANYVQFWFRRFRSGIFDFKDAPRTGRPVIKNVDKITEIIEVDRHVNSRSIIQELKIDHKTVLSHLRKVGLKKKLDVTYDNIVRKRSWSNCGEAAQTVAKPGLTARKVLLCIWWDWRGIICYELLPYGQTLNSHLYCQQLDRLKLAIDQKRPELDNRRGVVFHQDNARTHTSVVTRHNLWELGWEVLMHPPYSPDLAPPFSRIAKLPE
ncbi:histone-lysine N-methyltransferase SETMAR [Trichonephila clavipes]|nr:histone-lysine N-methyltransferase SETMAR [Trichonephila clavipes]